MVVDLVMEISMKTKVVIVTHVVSINTVLTLSIYAQKIKIEKTKINLKKCFPMSESNHRRFSIKKTYANDWF